MVCATAQLVLAGLQVVVDEGARQHRLAVVARGELDGGLPLLVLGLLEALLEARHVRAEHRRLEDEAPRTPVCGSTSTMHGVSALTENFHRSLASTTAVSPKWSPSARVSSTMVVAVLALRPASGPCHGRAGTRARPDWPAFDDQLPRLVLLLDEPGRQGVEHVLRPRSRAAAAARSAPAGTTSTLAPDVAEAQAPVAHRVAEAAVDAVRRRPTPGPTAAACSSHRGEMPCICGRDLVVVVS